MGRPKSRRTPRVSPAHPRNHLPVCYDVDDKVHKRRGIWSTFRIRFSRSIRKPHSTKKSLSRRILFLSIIGLVTLSFTSHTTPRGDTKLSYRVMSNPGGGIRREQIQVHVSGEQIMIEAGYVAKPRSMGYYFAGIESHTFLGAQHLDPNMKRRLTHNIVEMTQEEVEAQELLENSEDYDVGRADPFEEGDCVAQYEWQKTSYPTCNLLHEYTLTSLYSRRKRKAPARLVNAGYWRDVWLVRDYKRRAMIVKTLRYDHDWEERNYERHRRDAVAMERLTSSPNVIDIYGFCGNSGISEYAPGGDIFDALWDKNKPKTLNNTERVFAAYQIASGISDLHNFAKEGQAAIAHTDISTGQFVDVKGRYKLNDFNRCRFIRWNEKEQKPCPFHVGNNPGAFRAPEEYAYKDESEKIDVYSMGNVFYSLLTESYPFEDIDDKEAQAKILAGERPPIPQDILDSTEPEHRVILKAIEMSWVHDPKERATAREVAGYLDREARKLGVKSYE